MTQENMTPRERFIAALQRRPFKGRVPTFELVFFPTMEAFGKVHPGHRSYHQWYQMTESERQLHRHDMADLWIAVAEKYQWSAIMFQANPGEHEEIIRIADLLRDKIGDKYFLMVHGDATYGVPGGQDMLEFTYRLADEPDKMKQEADDWVNRMLERGADLKEKTNLDGFALCGDYCYNSGPFLSPAQFGEFVTPNLAKLVAGYRDMGYYTIKHTDGNIMPIVDQIVECKPDALHSLDPQGGVDIAQVKRLYGDKICLAGNVNCGLMDTGTDEEVIESARYALKHGMPGGGYIFCTSNCVYTGMKLKRYDLILDVWRKEGNYE